MESDARRNVNGFADNYQHIVIDNELFSLKEIVARNIDTCDKFIDSLLNFLKLKRFSHNAATQTILILLFSFTDNSNFIVRLHSYVYELFDSIDGCHTYWHIILEERDNNLIFLIKELPFDPDERILIS